MDSSFHMGQIAKELSKMAEENKLKTFFEAADSGNTHRVLSILVEDTQLLVVRTQEGNTALMLAAKNNHFETVENLIKIDSQIIHLVNQNGDTALMFAASLGHTKVVAHLIENDANILKENKQGDNALTLAAKNHQDKTVFQLMGAISPFKLPLLKQMTVLKPFVESFEKQTAEQAQMHLQNSLGWEKPKLKTRARKKRDLTPSLLASTSSSDSRPFTRLSNATCDAAMEKPLFKKPNGRTDTESWRSGSSALTFVAPVAVKKLNPTVSDFMPESPSLKAKKEFDLNFPPLVRATESDSWKNDPVVNINNNKFR